MQIKDEETKKIITRIQYVENEKTKYVLKKLGFESKEVEFFTLELADLENGIIKHNDKNKLFWPDNRKNWEDLTDIEVTNWKEINELEYEIELKYPKYVLNRYNNEYIKKYIIQECKITLREPILN